MSTQEKAANNKTRKVSFWFKTNCVENSAKQASDCAKFLDKGNDKGKYPGQPLNVQKNP